MFSMLVHSVFFPFFFFFSLSPFFSLDFFFFLFYVSDQSLRSIQFHGAREHLGCLIEFDFLEEIAIFTREPAQRVLNTIASPLQVT